MMRWLLGQWPDLVRRYLPDVEPVPRRAGVELGAEALAVGLLDRAERARERGDRESVRLAVFAARAHLMEMPQGDRRTALVRRALGLLPTPGLRAQWLAPILPDSEVRP